MSLIEKAKSKASRKGGGISNDSEEMIHLSVAWIHDEVTLSQCARVLEVDPTRVYQKIVLALKHGVKQGKITIK